LLDDLLVPRAGERRNLLALRGVGRQALSRAARVDGEVLLHGPDHRQSRGLAARDELGEHGHDRLQALRVDARDAERSLVVDEGVLQVDDQQRGGAQVEAVEYVAHRLFSSMSMPSTPARPQLSFGTSWM